MPHLYYLSSNKAKPVEEQEDRGGVAPLCSVGARRLTLDIFYFVLK